MSRLERLQTVEGVMGDRARDAARALAEAGARLATERERLAQLQRFRDDYRNQRDGGQAAMDAFRLRDFNAFMSRLDDAVRQQEERIAELEQQERKARAHWEHEQRRADALGKLVGQECDQQAREIRRQEQSQADELAQRMFTHRHKP